MVIISLYWILSMTVSCRDANQHKDVDFCLAVVILEKKNCATAILFGQAQPTPECKVSSKSVGCSQHHVCWLYSSVTHQWLRSIFGSVWCYVLQG